MMYVSVLLGLGFVFWVIGVSSNVSVYYGVVNLVFAAVMGCGVIVWKGGSFLSLVLFLIYLGGMLVIFSYSAALVLEQFPAALANWEGVIHVLNYGLLIGVLLLIGWDLWGIEGFGEGTVDADGLSVVRVDFMGLSLLYGGGWGVLFAAGIGMLLTFFVVLVLVRGLYSVACRAI